MDKTLVEREEAWDWLATRPDLELSHTRWDDDDEWRVHRVSGGRNDQEWKLIGEGDSPWAAVLHARQALTAASPEAE